MFAEIISSITDIQISRDGRYILARDYMTLKLWDINNDAKPVKIFRIHDQIQNRFPELYENDLIFDKFECSFSPDGKRFLTGSYQDTFVIFNEQGKMEALQLSKLPPKKKRNSIWSKFKTSDSSSSSPKISDKPPVITDFDHKCLNLNWHCSHNILALSSNANLYIYGSS